jgi:hypothetical protein
MSRYPHWDVLTKWATPDWDDPTRQVVRRRLEEVPPIQFLNSEQVTTLTAVVDRIIPQSHRAQSDRIPIVPWIDEKLHADRRDGYRYEDVPPLRDAWRDGLAGVNDTARVIFGRAFVELGAADQDEVLARLERGDAPGEMWQRFPPRRFFRDVLCLTVANIYYAHPAAWNEIGYSGPSSPRGHVRNWIGGVDPWDAPESHRE